MGKLVEEMGQLVEIFPLGQGQRLAAFLRVGDEQFRQHRRPPVPGRFAIMLAHRRAKHLRSVAQQHITIRAGRLDHVPREYRRRFPRVAQHPAGARNDRPGLFASLFSSRHKFLPWATRRALHRTRDYRFENSSPRDLLCLRIHTIASRE